MIVPGEDVGNESGGLDVNLDLLVFSGGEDGASCESRRRPDMAITRADSRKRGLKKSGQCTTSRSFFGLAIFMEAADVLLASVLIILCGNPR